MTYIVSGGALNSTHSLTPHPPTSALPLFNEGLGISPWENCGIKDVCRYVLEHFDGLMRLFSHETKKVKFPLPSSIFFVARGFRDAFCIAGGAFGRHWWIRRLTRRTQDFTCRGFTLWGMARESRGRKSPSEVQGPVGVLDEVASPGNYILLYEQ